LTDPPKPIYCVDTSALIDWLEETYPPEHFPAMIQRVDALIADGRFLISEEVYKESQQSDQETKRWCVPRRDRIVVPTDTQAAAEAARILAAFPGLVNPRTNKGGADPFVIAVARLRGATVVTGERGGKPARPRIPFVCDQMGIPHTNFVGMVRIEGWRF
jgi:hypothetical protein